MKNIRTKKFNVFRDYKDVYDFMKSIYTPDCRNGVSAPFFEYAYHSFSYWMDLSYSYLNRIWLDGEEIVAFCFSENPVTNIFFSLRPGYEELAEEMITYAEEHMPHIDGKFCMVLLGEQKALIEVAKRKGYRKVFEQAELCYDCATPLDYSLPEGFRFTDPAQFDVEKISECCWKGFDHEASEGKWDRQYINNNYLLVSAPHATTEYGVAIENEAGEYVCWAGMWWVPDNKLAYLEPLCTVPQYRRKGLAAAALSEIYRKVRPLGVEILTGGYDEFYKKIGYKPLVIETYWEK